MRLCAHGVCVSVMVGTGEVVCTWCDGRDR